MVQRLRQTEENPILMYRVPNTQEESHDRTKSLLIVLATQFQLKMLHDFGKNHICIDSTHDTAGYSFYLTSIVVVDDYGNGIPAAFCLSSGCSATEWETFFTVVKDKIRSTYELDTIKANVFMSDNDPSFYSAWVKIMGAANMRLVCSWHIDRAWRDNLKVCI